MNQRTGKRVVSEWRATTNVASKPNKPVVKPHYRVEKNLALLTLVILLGLTILHFTAPQRTHVECKGTDVPRYCVD